jgi:hypothetical protein
MIRLVFGRLAIDGGEESLCELEFAHVCFSSLSFLLQAYQRLAESEGCQNGWCASR